MTLVKICGITSLEDAIMCVEAGADALGFNFYSHSPRYIEPQAVRKIMDQLPADVLTVGVFVNEETELVKQITTRAGVAAVQLHGEESPEYCRQFADRYVIKVLAASKVAPEEALAYEVQAIMLDASNRKARGGTGRVIDWSLARRARDLVPRFFLAGGLAPENVGEALATVDPYGVDACSALETSPGIKNPARVRAFVKATRAAALAVKR